MYQIDFFTHFHARVKTVQGDFFYIFLKVVSKKITHESINKYMNK